MRPIVSFLLGCVCILGSTSIVRADATLERDLPPGFDLVPPDASGAVVIPNLKRASDDFTRMLEGMERAHVLLGARPMDQLRALLGLQVGVNELDAAAIVFMDSDSDTAPVFVIPVTNTSDFLDSNFDPLPGGPDNAYLYANGTTVYSKALAHHVVLSENASLIESYAPRPGLAHMLADRFGERASKVMANGEIILYADAGMMSKAVDRAQQGPMRQPFRLIPPELLDGADAGVVVINFDPLGLGINTLVAMDPQSATGRLTKGGAMALSPMSRLPNGPFYLAGSIDFVGLGGADLVEMLLPAAMVDVPEWLRGMQGAQFVVSSSSLGLQGGLLNEAVLFIATDRPQETRAILEEKVMASAKDDETVHIAPSWQHEIREIAGVTVDAYEIQTRFKRMDLMRRTMQGLAFGGRGVNGFVGEVDGGLVVTFSQRPEVFARAVRAAAGTDTLAADPVLRQMRTWLPPDADIEVFLGVGSMGNLITQVAGVFQLDPSVIPQIDPDTKPVAVGIEVGDGTIETAWVFPSDVLALIFDAAADQFVRVNEMMNDRDD